jgi:hypothetical protein
MRKAARRPLLRAAAVGEPQGREGVSNAGCAARDRLKPPIGGPSACQWVASSCPTLEPPSELSLLCCRVFVAYLSLPPAARPCVALSPATFLMAG